MPLRGENHNSDVVDESPYFTNLDELDAWAVNPPKKLTEGLKFPPNAPSAGTPKKLLFCHDYKGGYQELANPSAQWYTFNYWSYCDTFVYFSHHRVTVPPSGWITAAHRQGVKMLGTLIFEGTEDLLRIITGPLPNSTVSILSPQSGGSVALSPHYARVLADLAYQRGFDGYLLNFEGNLVDKTLEARALASWMTVLQSELQTKIGPYAQTIWYDSVIPQGEISYQERIDSLDLPFFIPSTGFFTDYHWNPSDLDYSATFLGKLNPQDFGFIQTRGDIFVGVDVYGRGTWYKKGFGCSTAIKAIDAAHPSLSVALFAPGWTWESQKSGTLWNDWFEFDKEMWVGAKQGETIPPNDDGSPYVPICKYFKRNPPPNPATLTFYTSFCPGTGLNWFVNGVQVLETTDGWTDLQKQTSLGDLLWPQPEMRWDVGCNDPPDVWPAFAADKSWNGGGCMGINFSTSAAKSSGRLPIQSLPATLGQEYTVTLIYNATDAGDLVTLDLRLSVEPLSAPLTTVITAACTQSQDLSSGWCKLSTTFSVQDLTSQSKRSNNDGVLVSVGLNVSYSGLKAGSSGFVFYLGQMTVVPVLPAALDGSTVLSNVLWADFSTTTTGTASTLPTGILTWDVTSFFVPATVDSTVDTKPQWTLQDPAQWLPKFIYFNVYAQAFGSDGKIGGPESASFMGTTGLDGRGQRFFVDESMWPDGILGASKARLYVQGVTDQGEVLPWDRCAYIDISVDS